MDTFNVINFVRQNLTSVIMFLLYMAFITYQDYRIDNLKEEITVYKTQIEMVKAESDILKKRVESARAVSEEQIKESIDGANKILASNVPDDCHAAIQWAVAQAQGV